MKIYIKVNSENKNIVFIGTENELDENEIKNGWIFLKDENEEFLPKIIDGTYFGNPLIDENGSYNYKYENNSISLLESSEKIIPKKEITIDERILAIESAILSILNGGI